jgi:hypothetical protein
VLTAADTLKRPTAAAYVPLTIGARPGTMRWNRDQLFAAGALTLGELIAQVPGVTLMTTGFIQAPAHLAWHGDPGAVRVVIDGIERDEINPRNAGVTDFSTLPLWALEEVSLEETAGELRVHARTWRVERTTASTRTDVLTGSENLNLFRGFFGKRSVHGVAVQLAAQQASTLSQTGMDGDALGAFARIGWAAGDWSVDAMGLRQGISRTVGARYTTTETPVGNGLPPLQGAVSMGYVRAAWREAGGEGIWAQVLAGTNLSSKSDASGSASISAPAVSADSGDTTASQGEYLAAAGLDKAGLRLSGHLRARSRLGKLDIAPLARAEFTSGLLAVSGAIGARMGGGSIWNARAQAAPFSWVRASASASMTPPSGSNEARLSTSADVALALRNRWISAGVRQLAAGTVMGVTGLDSTAIAATLPAAAGVAISASGPISRGWHARTEVMRWESGSFYRPQTQARSRIWFESSFLDKLPGGNFHLLAALTHQYQSQLVVPSADPGGQSTRSWSVFGTLLEIRIANAVVTWDYRNMAGIQFDTFPGYLMPRNSSFYGIRWNFWN